MVFLYNWMISLVLVHFLNILICPFSSQQWSLGRMFWSLSPLTDETDKTGGQKYIPWMHVKDVLMVDLKLEKSFKDFGFNTLRSSHLKLKVLIALLDANANLESNYHPVKWLDKLLLSAIFTKRREIFLYK